ncbi:D-alanyl-D-alanine carboxypeptidase family protein [Opitutus sp. ER46]|uniref:D-alanyl-D-alanine carboxypeptidase family protein n=1 Tax=Opitutus sp. ER46 TaxID=2161864 RepID=UPI000D319AF4|nr:D-alanyl-D-alanine carboxypeptidase family protein [Opitutus sp. ER46]PTX99078.1 D-alanyl-D-alanine carboxypeptidase [Opitutus sp. ER46]
MVFSSRFRTRILGGLLVLVAVVAALPAAHAAGARAKSGAAKAQPTYRSIIATDATSGAVLVEENADEVGAPASMTKLMTYAVLADKLAAGNLSLDTVVKIDKSDCGMGGTQVYLDPRESFTVEELIYAMMIQSANDAAHALARVSAGSRDAFVALMNQKARELGMTKTTFRSPHGLPPSTRRTADGDITTARDFAVLCRHLLLHTDVLKYSSVRQRDFGPLRKQGPLQMVNHNKLVGEVDGVDGLKTGFTKDAGYCLSATAERNGRRVIVVIMGALGPGGQLDYGRSRDRKTIETLERAFAALPTEGPTFASERAKYVKPAVIAIEPGRAAPAAGSPSAPAGTPEQPSITFPLPRK